MKQTIIVFLQNTNDKMEMGCSKVFKNSHYQTYTNLLYQQTGITISKAKRDLLQSKIQRLINRKKIKSFDDHLSMIYNNTDPNELQELINTLTINTTEFFREKSHFDFIIQNINLILKRSPRILESKEIRIWSAACSTGQEAVTLSMILRECLGNDFCIKILATDINSNVLNKAASGYYSNYEVEHIPTYYLEKYFSKTKGGYTVKESVLSTIKYRYFNLMGDFNFKKEFDIVFCRNVMIYFDNQVQQELINKFYSHLVDGGMLFIGHSESLFNKVHRFKYLGPSIYAK